MRAQDLTRIKFRYTHHHLVFECLFFAEGDPFELVLGCLRHNFAIVVPVFRGYEIHPYIGPREVYEALRRALFRDAGSGQPFSPTVFFEEFDRHIPARASPGQVPTPADIVRHDPRVEDADKKWFCGWRDNTAEGKRVTPENLAKTRRLLGPRAHEFSQRRNHSTRWTHRPEDAKAFFLPA
jgi:hypothetical protein